MERVSVYVDENLEFLLSVLLAADYDTLLLQRFGFQMLRVPQDAYARQIRAFFAPHRRHPVFALLREMPEKGFFFNRPVELMLSLEDAGCFRVLHPLSELCVSYSGGLEQIRRFLFELGQLYESSGYRMFFEGHADRYTDFLEQVRQQAEQFQIDRRLEQMYGHAFDAGAIVVTSLLCGNYGIRFSDPKTGSLDAYAVFADSKISENPEENEFSGGALSLYMLFHEFSHPYINPLTEKYRELAGRYVDAYEKLKAYKLPGAQSGYGDWEECINEHFVRAMAIHLLRGCGFGAWAQSYYEQHMRQGYRYLPLILEAYRRYEANRDRYPDFEAFYPELLTVFSAPDI